MDGRIMIDAIARTLTRLASVARIIGGRWIRALATGLAAEYDRIVAFRDKVYCAAIPSSDLCEEAIDDLERKYGIAVFADATTEERKSRVLERASLFGSMGPGWIEEKIQAAGFPLYVVENTPAADIRVPRPDALYRFQTVPDFPDNVAGALYKRDKNWTVTTGWTGGTGVTLSIESATLKAVSTTPGIANAYISGSVYQNKLVRIIVKSSIPLTNITTITGSSVDTRMIMQALGANRYIADVYWSRTGSDALQIWPDKGLTTTPTWYLESIYIGSGLYDTLVTDDSGHGNDLVNNGVLPVYDTTLGRDVMSFNGAQYLRADNPVIGTTGTIAFKIKRTIATGENYIFDNRTSTTSGMSLRFSGAVLRIAINGLTPTGYGSQTLSDTVLWHSIVVSLDATALKIYIDSVLSEVISNPVAMVAGTANLIIGRNIPATAYSNVLLSDIQYKTNIWTQDDVDWYHTHGGLISNAGYTQFGDVQFDNTTQFGAIPSRVDPSTVAGVLITSSANKPGGRRVAEDAQFGVGMQFGSSSQFGSPDPSYSYPMPAERVYPTDPVYWGCVFFLSPVQGRLATEDEMLYLSEDQVAYLTRLVIQLKPLKRWCVAQVATRVVMVDDLDDAILTFEDGEIWTA